MRTAAGLKVRDGDRGRERKERGSREEESKKEQEV